MIFDYQKQFSLFYHPKQKQSQNKSELNRELKLTLKLPKMFKIKLKKITIKGIVRKQSETNTLNAEVTVLDGITLTFKG